MAEAEPGDGIERGKTAAAAGKGEVAAAVVVFAGDCVGGVSFGRELGPALWVWFG